MLGFYFSFLAVAILIIVNQRYKQEGIKKIMLMQSGCLLGLLPLNLHWFSYASLNSLLVNLIAIPWVGLAIVPLALINTFLSPLLIIPGSVFLLENSIKYFLLFLTWINNILNFPLEFTFAHAFQPLFIMLAALIFALQLLHFLPAAFLYIITSFY